MKKDIIHIALLALGVGIIMTAAALWRNPVKETPAQLSPEEISWIEFCKARDYDIHNPTQQMEVEFLDTWVGSTEEEEALTRNGVII